MNNIPLLAKGVGEIFPKRAEANPAIDGQITMKRNNIQE
jgi:hypothetical protein